MTSASNVRATSGQAALELPTLSQPCKELLPLQLFLHLPLDLLMQLSPLAPALMDLLPFT